MSILHGDPFQSIWDDPLLAARRYTVSPDLTRTHLPGDDGQMHDLVPGLVVASITRTWIEPDGTRVPVTDYDEAAENDHTGEVDVIDDTLCLSYHGVACVLTDAIARELVVLVGCDPDDGHARERRLAAVQREHGRNRTCLDDI